MKFPLQLPIDNSLPRALCVMRHMASTASGGHMTIELLNAQEMEAVNTYIGLIYNNHNTTGTAQ